LAQDTNAYSPARLWLKKNIWSLTSLAVVVLACFFIVQHFKKPGQMSVIESQAMDMTAMKPTRGAVPVAVAAAKEDELDASVTYTGAVQAFEDEDVYPRITGRIVAMPVYPGDRVKPGQLLVQLDPAVNSEYSAKLQESQYAADAAVHNSSIAKEELTQKAFDLDAAKAAEDAVLEELKQAQADLDYWTAEISRETSLLKTQVISQQEFDDEQNKYKQAKAKVKQMTSKLAQAKNARLSAFAASEAAAHHVGHIMLTAKEAQAAQQTAEITNSYTRILAQSPGVVTKRLISPGVTVSPGMMILKISHMRKVRVQAQVAPEDAARISVGNSVHIKNAANAKEEIEASVTALFPAADPNTKTVVVEALIDNVGRPLGAHGVSTVKNLGTFRLLPGEYVVMRISVGEKRAVVVPSSAIIWRNGKAQVWKAQGGSGNKTGSLYTCLMHPEIKSPQPGKCPKCGMELVPTTASGSMTAQLADIEVGLSNENETEVVSGVKSGDSVIYAGFANLQDGMPVVATDWDDSGPAKLPEASAVQHNRLDASNKFSKQFRIKDIYVSTTLETSGNARNNFVCLLKDLQGKPVEHASVNAKTSMPSMSMAGPNLSAEEKSGGRYVFTTNFMSGLWRIDLTINGEEISVDADVP
jgi:multidrug efflux pump subunit AcrA (membrane-fusion protein)